eukprot:PLAT3322.2.p1 GENE.PLAT3322.2~~PLAT3322.2.p1  ORF type:complete len:924 (+),score=436.22 PLAT3322.2:357-2774(+)
MDAFLTEVEIQLHGTELVYAVSNSDASAALLVAQGVAPRLVAAARAYPGDERVQGFVAGALRNLTYGSSEVGAPIVDAGGVDVLLEALRSMAAQRDVVRRASAALMNLAGMDHDAVARAGGVDTVCAVLRRNSRDADVAGLCCGILFNLSLTPAVARRIAEDGAILLLSGIMKTLGGDAQIMRWTLGTLHALAGCGAALTEDLKAVLPEALAVADRHRSTAAVVGFAASLLARVGPSSERDGKRALEMAAACMPAHRAVLLTQRRLALAIARVVADKPPPPRMLVVLKLHTALMDAMRTHADDGPLAEASIAVLTHLVRDAPAVRLLAAAAVVPLLNDVASRLPDLAEAAAAVIGPCSAVPAAGAASPAAPSPTASPAAGRAPPAVPTAAKPALRVSPGPGGPARRGRGPVRGGMARGAPRLPSGPRERRLAASPKAAAAAAGGAGSPIARSGSRSGSVGAAGVAGVAAMRKPPRGRPAAGRPVVGRPPASPGLRPPPRSPASRSASSGGIVSSGLRPPRAPLPRSTSDSRAPATSGAPSITRSASTTSARDDGRPAAATGRVAALAGAIATPFAIRRTGSTDSAGSAPGSSAYSSSPMGGASSPASPMFTSADASMRSRSPAPAMPLPAAAAAAPMYSSGDSSTLRSRSPAPVPAMYASGDAMMRSASPSPLGSSPTSSPTASPVATRRKVRAPAPSLMRHPKMRGPGSATGRSSPMMPAAAGGRAAGSGGGSSSAAASPPLGAMDASLASRPGMIRAGPGATMSQRGGAARGGARAASGRGRGARRSPAAPSSKKEELAASWL